MKEIIKILEGWGYTHEESMELAELVFQPSTIADHDSLDEVTHKNIDVLHSIGFTSFDNV